jgi:outer membrane protein OmpA-like peptidoglycan-associated protein
MNRYGQKAFQLKIFLLVFILVISIPSIEAQNREFVRANFPDDSRGLREARKNVEEGEKYYNLEIYEKALEYFLKAHHFNPENNMLNLRIGECYLATAFKTRAVEYLEKAIRLNVPAREVYYLLGVAYQQNYRFDEALEQFGYYRQVLSPQEAIRERSRIEQRMMECENARKLVESPVRVFIDNPGSNINSEYDDYSAMLSVDGNTMYFTSRRPMGNKPKLDKIDQKYVENIHVSQLQGKQWQPAQPLLGKVNTKTHEATAGISRDGRTLYVYRGDKGGDLFESYWEGDQFGKPKRMSSFFTSKGTQETSIVFTSDGQKAFFISNRPGGLGGKDIWSSFRDEKGRWSEPVNLGATVNTPFDEESLYLSPDNHTLYFSSQGHNTMGGYDIFKTEFRHGSWTKPQNLGHPVNTPGDDLFFVMSPDGKTGFYSSMKPYGYGSSDIYMVTFLGPEKQPELPVVPVPLASIVRPLAHNLMEQQVEVIHIPMTILRGRILDDKEGNPLVAVLELYDNENEMLLAQFTSNAANGEYLISLPGGKNYGISVKADNFLFHSENINISESLVTREIINDIRLKKVEVGETIILNNIFFDTGAASLRAESYVELGILFRLMTENPSLKIEISGHTDNVGSAALNRRISEMRARAVVEFLIARGIASERLSYKGYGFERPIASNDSAAGRQQNRRTEFEIIEK